MSSVIQLSILLLLSAVFAEHGGFSIHSNMKLKLKNLALSSSSIMRDQHEGDLKIGTYAAPPKWQKNPLFCCTCQDFVTKTKPKVDSKIQLKIYKFCNMFIQNVKKTCLDKAFLACSVIGHGERRSDESDLQWEVEELTASLQEVALGAYENSTWKLPYKCCMCKESLRTARFLIMSEIQAKAENICSLVKSVREQCMSKAKMYSDKIVRALFPGGPQAICKNLKVCK
ncbi:hypothetical protein AMELA_G00128710 [Ameiurus melas]|uniref:Saposin B-type domain-containing protein n=1 Tax=Ameiurus melas TaxID=219545 RepID=A0A7J6ANV4_AMEME|nr:hypothetical protein AMELA_G00128710 [Ameiurus melas]